jgi:hypothetical protein
MLAWQTRNATQQNLLPQKDIGLAKIRIKEGAAKQ